MKEARRIHIIKMPTNTGELFPYSHYNDKNHDPYLVVDKEDDKLVMICEDSFKLKPNVQRKKLTRVDIYIPKYAALQLGDDIKEYFGEGIMADNNSINPENYRIGEQTLPIIMDSKQIKYCNARFDIAGFTVEGVNKNIYIDLENPNMGHREMIEQEIHLGIPLEKVNGILNNEMVWKETVPNSEIRVRGEVNPVKKANGVFKIKLDRNEAKKLATTLIHYANI